MLEWFSADAKAHTKRSQPLVAGDERAFVPLEGGGVLAVVRPSTGVTDFKTVCVISADGVIEPALPIDPATLDTVRLFPGSGGAPVLWTGRRWLRWQPWFGAFQPIADAPAELTNSQARYLLAFGSLDAIRNRLASPAGRYHLEGHRQGPQAQLTLALA